MPVSGLAFAGPIDLGESGEEEKGGTEGLLRLAAVRCAGSEGPGRGVVSESSESSVAERDCDSEAVELETGEHGRGAIVSGTNRGAMGPR